MPPNSMRFFTIFSTQSTHTPPKSTQTQIYNFYSTICRSAFVSLVAVFSSKNDVDAMMACLAQVFSAPFCICVEVCVSAASCGAFVRRTKVAQTLAHFQSTRMTSDETDDSPRGQINDALEFFKGDIFSRRFPIHTAKQFVETSHFSIEPDSANCLAK